MVMVLCEKGFKLGDYIGIYFKNCYYWILVDLVILMGGYVFVLFYVSLFKD